MSNKSLPTFITERLILREISHEDIPSYEKYFINYEVIQHLAVHIPWPYPKNGVREYLDNSIFPIQGKTLWLWGIFEKTNPAELIGAVQLWREGKPENRGFWLGKPFWGKGYMTESVGPVMDYAFNNLSFEKLIFANAVENLKSRRVKEKTGAHLIDIQPAQFVNPEYTQHEIWELKNENWNNPLPAYYILNSDPVELQIDAIHGLLSTAYWCKGIPKETLVKAINNSLCFGVYNQKQQIGFARVVSDSATFAWICDVIIDEKFRGRGLSKELMKLIMNHPNLKGLRRICLATKDAHALYEKFKFKVTETPQYWMEIKNNSIYQR